MRAFLVTLGLFGLAGCTMGDMTLPNLLAPKAPDDAAAAAPAMADGPPLSAMGGDVLDMSGLSDDPLDDTPVTDADALAAETAALLDATPASPAGDGTLLGRSTVSLGDPTETGFVVDTPLVQDAVEGRVVDPATGKYVVVTLRPQAGSGSRASLPVLQALGLPVTALTEMEIYAR